MLHDVVKAATRLAGSYEGCHIGFCEGCNEALWLMRRLPHRLKADAKDAIKVAGFYKGCHIAEKVATLLKRLYRGHGLDILHKTNPNRGSYEDRDASTLRLLGGAFYGAFDEAFYGAFEEKAKGSSRRRSGASTGSYTEIRPRGIRGEGQGLQGEGRGSSPNLTKSDGNAHKRSGGYVIRWHLEEIHVTWAHLEKKRTRLQTYTKSMKKYCSQSVETASKAYSDTVVTYPVTTSEI
ncbi:hypothetical protein Tco_0356779 [Tanacetum coccineum]